MTPQQSFEKIEAYLNGELDEVQLKIFEEQMKKDDALAAQVHLFKNMDLAISDKSALQFQKLVQKEANPFFQKSSAPEAKIRKLSWTSRSWTIAASILVLIISATLLFQKFGSSDPVSNQELFAQNFMVYDLDENLRSSAIEPDLFQAGIREYQKENYSAAIDTFQNLQKSTPNDMVLAFALGNTFLNQNPSNFRLAQAEFQKVIEEDNSIYVSKAKWYLALIYINNGRINLAKNLLQEVVESGDNLSKNAEHLLKDLQ